MKTIKSETVKLKTKRVFLKKGGCMKLINVLADPAHYS